MAMTIFRAWPLREASRFRKRAPECFLNAEFSRGVPGPFLAAFRGLWNPEGASRSKVMEKTMTMAVAAAMDMAINYDYEV